MLAYFRWDACLILVSVEALLLCSYFAVEEESGCALLLLLNKILHSGQFNALSDQLFDWENNETHLLLQIVRLKTKRYI